MAEARRHRTGAPDRVAMPATAFFPWLVFGLSFALLLSDFMCRQVLASVFPLLKVQWALSDTQLGLLGGLVAVTVGVLTVPLSFMADRFGRRRAVLVMAAVWSLATLGTALAAGYGQLLVSRIVLGVGEAGYGSVGLALVLSIFPSRRRASLSGAFQAGGSFGSVLGVALGGLLAVRLGWRWSVAAMGLIGLALVLLYRQLVSSERLAAHRLDSEGNEAMPAGVLRSLSGLLAVPALRWAYLAAGLQLFVAGSLLVWLPSYLHRVDGWTPGTAAGVAALVLLGMSTGMVACGMLTDRLAGGGSGRIWTTAMTYAMVSAVLLAVGFSLGPGGAAVVVLAAGAFFAAGTAGPAGALVAALSASHVRAGALGVLALANNLLGLAAGPLVVGVLADRLGLGAAMRLVPLVSLAVIAFLALGRRADPAHPAADR